MADDRVHDRAVLDALESIEAKSFEADVCRVTRKGRDALRGSSIGGRWGPSGEFEVLNTSLEGSGALAEVGYRLSLEPVWPSRMEHQLHRVAVRMERTLGMDRAGLAGLGVDVERYESFEYGATQAIAAAARFLEFDSLLVPSARHPCRNLIVFLDRLSRTGRLEVRQTKAVDWTVW